MHDLVQLSRTTDIICVSPRKCGREKDQCHVEVHGHMVLTDEATAKTCSRSWTGIARKTLPGFTDDSSEEAAQGQRTWAPRIRDMTRHAIIVGLMSAQLSLARLDNPAGPRIRDATFCCTATGTTPCGVPGHFNRKCLHRPLGHRR